MGEVQTTGTPSVSRITDKVWALRLPAPTIYFAHVYAYLIHTGAGLVLIDAGDATPAGWDGLQAAIAQAGFAPTDISAILLTHTHYDHCGNAARLRDVSGALIGMGACGARHFTPRPRCPVCRSGEIFWDKSSGKGEVYSFTIVCRKPAEGFEVPFVLALITLAVC